MSKRTLKPDAVEESMARLVLDQLVEPKPRVLVAGDPDDLVVRVLSERGARVATWSRFAGPGRSATLRPPPGEVDEAVLRMPRVRASLDFALHGLAARLVAAGAIWVVGTNEEGIRSAPRRLEALFEEVVTVDTRRHGRLLCGRRRAELPGLRGTFEEWRAVGSIELPGGTRPWVTYPGLFARGELDAATALLVETLPRLSPGCRVLDFGCGSGILGAALAGRGDRFELDQLDADVLAVAAARENLPQARTWLGSSLDDVPVAAPWDRVLSNPPIHESVVRSYRTLDQFAAGVGRRLQPDGEVWLVAQRQVPVTDLFAQTALRAQIAAERSGFRVWRAQR